MSMNPTITIDLPPHLHDYLYHEFGTPRGEEAVRVTAANDLGKLIQSMITVSDRPPRQPDKEHRPPRQPDKEHPITLALPIQEWNHFIFQENFIYIPEWKQHMLQSYIEASYRIRIREYFVAGYEKGYKQDRIIRAFLYAYNIKENAMNYEAVKKYDYRIRKRMVREVDRDIQLSLFP